MSCPSVAPGRKLTPPGRCQRQRLDAVEASTKQANAEIRRLWRRHARTRRRVAALEVERVFSHSPSPFPPFDQGTNGHAAHRPGPFAVLDIPLSHVHFIDTITRCSRVVDALGVLARDAAKEGRLGCVGIDAEWKPRLRHAQDKQRGRHATPSPVAIVQLATGSAVFILDCSTLRRSPGGCAAIGRVFGLLLRSCELVVVGLDFAGDLRHLAHSFPELPCLRTVSQYLDGRELVLMRLAAAAGSHARAQTGHGTPTSALRARTQLSLAAVVMCFFDVGVDKSCQCSDWESRPLSPQQITYAALDAHILVRCFECVLAQLGSAAGDIMRATTTSLTCNDYCSSSSSSSSSDRVPRDQHVPPPEPLSPLGPSSVAAHLASVGVPRQVMCAHPGPATLHTLGVVGKTVGFITKQGPLVCILNEARTVDFRALATRGFKALRLARAEECVPVFGFAPGAFPVCGMRGRFQTLIDRDFADALVSSAAQGVLGGGSIDVVVALSCDQLLKCTAGVVCTFAKPSHRRTANDTSSSTPTTSENANNGSSGSSNDVNNKRGSGLPTMTPSGRFLVTEECERLAKWLRSVGTDTASTSFSSAAEFTDIFNQARDERRIILTCNRKLAGRVAGLACFLLDSNDVTVQFTTVVAHFGLPVGKVTSADTPLYGYFGGETFSKLTAATRCPKCNGCGFKGPTPAGPVNKACVSMGCTTVGPGIDVAADCHTDTDVACIDGATDGTATSVNTQALEWSCFNPSCDLVLRKEVKRKHAKADAWCSPRSLPDRQFRHTVRGVWRRQQGLPPRVCWHDGRCTSHSWEHFERFSHPQQQEQQVDKDGRQVPAAVRVNHSGEGASKVGDGASSTGADADALDGAFSEQHLRALLDETTVLSTHEKSQWLALQLEAKLLPKLQGKPDAETLQRFQCHKAALKGFSAGLCGQAKRAAKQLEAAVKKATMQSKRSSLGVGAPRRVDGANA